MSGNERRPRIIFPTHFSAALNANKTAIALEICLFLAILAAGVAGLMPFAGTPVLFLFAWISLRLRDKGWADYGFTKPAKWMLLVAVAVGVGDQFFSTYVVDPVLARWSGHLPDVSVFAPIVGNVKVLLFWLGISWTLAAFGEELIFRGYLMNRLAELGNQTKAAWVASLFVSSSIFALAHRYQGFSGIVAVMLSSLVLGTVYLLLKRNLLAVIVLHGATDTVGFLLMFFGKYPGL